MVAGMRTLYEKRKHSLLEVWAAIKEIRAKIDFGSKTDLDNPLWKGNTFGPVPRFISSSAQPSASMLALILN